MSDAPLGPGSLPLAPVAADGVALRAGFRPGAGRGLAVVLHGRTEFLEKYAPVFDALSGRGFAIASTDWRGQGASDRPVGHPLKGHVDDFAAFQRDLAALLAAIPPTEGPRVMIAHSMGGAIGLRALTGGGPGARFDAAIFSAPMWGLSGGRVALSVGAALARGATALGFGGRFAFGGGKTPYVLKGYEGNVLTSDPDEFARILRLTEAAPERALAGPTWGWLRAAFAEMAALAPLPLTTPALVAVGSAEKVVSRGAIRARAARDGLTLVELEGARHEPFFETPAIRARLWSAIDAFLASRGI